MIDISEEFNFWKLTSSVFSALLNNSICSSIVPGLSAFNAKPFLVRNLSLSWSSSSHPLFSIASPTLALYELAELEKPWATATRNDTLNSSTCESVCYRTKFMPDDSSASVAILIPRSIKLIWLINKSRKTPEYETTTAIRGRLSLSRGIISTLLTRPRESTTGDVHQLVRGSVPNFLRMF